MPALLQTPLTYLKGVGPKRAELLAKELKLETYGDLLFYFPFRYIDRTHFTPIGRISFEADAVQLKGIIRNIRITGQKRGRRLTATLSDGTGSVELIWFNGIPWIQKVLAENAQYLVYGKAVFFHHNFSITHPDIEPATQTDIQFSGKFQPVYPMTEKLKQRGITNKAFARLTYALLSQVQAHDVDEIIPQSVLHKYRLLDRYTACKMIHYPEKDEDAQQALRRFKFEELFIDQMKMQRVKKERHTESRGFVFTDIGGYFRRFYEICLPFSLTGAQKKVLKEIRRDVVGGKQMNRLLQGDVGSGKTIVALLSMLMAVDNGFQACMMAPTEILAQQHYADIARLCEPLGIVPGLLTGSIKGKQRKDLLEDLASGKMPLLIGTHALIESSVQFQNLGIVIIDEQHRFGVEQRAGLWTKNKMAPHILVMTATPIPRTLAMTCYGDLDVSVLDEMPPGRKEIKTIHKRESQRLAVFGFLRKEIREGRQVFIVYPLIEESEKLDLKNLMEGVQAIERAFPRPEFQVGILHGKMKPADKEFEMQRFLKRQTQILVSTTVVEVGVHVPNATVMVIENAERFGLAQLHQLRGRVGRSGHQSWCILMTGEKLSNDARKRIQTMVQTNDGFQIAEMDMQLRGPGELQGTRQSGVPVFRVADLKADSAILREAALTANALLDEDPLLGRHENLALRRFLEAQTGDKPAWGKVS